MYNYLVFTFCQLPSVAVRCCLLLAVMRELVHKGRKRFCQDYRFRHILSLPLIKFKIRQFKC